jgi:uncharacterized membrane protein HdeD (DUF308 family)
MFSHGERKQLWITLAGLLVVLVGVAVTVTWSHFFGAIVALVGALLLGVGAFGQLRLTSHDQRRPLWIALAGGSLITVGFAMVALTNYKLVGSILSLIGALIMFAGGVTTAIKTKHANPRLPRTIEEQRQIIRTIAKHREL